MPLSHNDLWSQVLWSSTKSVTLIDDLLGEPEIGDPQMPVRTDEQILRLQISICDLSFMQILEGESYFSNIEQSYIIWETVFFSE